MNLSVVIVSWNTADLLVQCLEALPAAVGAVLHEVIVVDNGSSDRSAEMVRAGFPTVQLITNPENRGFVQASNQGISLSQGRYVLLLNSDVIAPMGSISRMVEFLERRPDIGAVAPKLLNPDGSFQASYAQFPTLISESLSAFGLNRVLYGHTHPSPLPLPGERPHPVDWVPGACLLVRREALDAIGSLDEGYWMYSEDTDLCYRLWQTGWKVYYLPDVEVVHLGAASSRQCRPESVGRLYRSKVRFFRKHYGVLPALLLSLVISVAYWIKASVAVVMTPVPPLHAHASGQLRTSRYVWQGCLEALRTKAS